jgi:uncharacterized alpha-E superfamily protein
VPEDGLKDDPRSLAAGGDKWITDVRIYNLIWMGRWLERSENLCRALDSAALVSKGKSDEMFAEALDRVSSAWGLESQGAAKALDDLVWNSPTSSILTCLQKARENASQVAPLELMQAINVMIRKLEQKKAEGMDCKPESLHAFVTDLLTDHKAAFAIIEQTWFRREPLEEEEIMRRFVQQ